jgi:hypothetical protein
MPQKSAPRLQIPDCVETCTFRAIESVLKNDRVLAPLIRHFSALRDEDADFVPPAWNLCPYLSLSVSPITADWITEGQHTAGFSINFLMAVPGTNIDNLFNFWGVIRRAIFPLDVAEAELIRAKIRQAHQDVEGATRARIRQMVDYMPQDTGELTQRYYVGKGIIDFPMLIRT